jgi:enoyl-CoA hydratase
MTDKLHYEQVGDVAVITLDDGKANACGFAMLEAIGTALDRARLEARAVALIGRPGVLSGGFDLKVINGGDASELRRLITLGVRTLMRLYGHPQPVVIGATGHAVALGAFMLLAGDYRVGTAGDYRVGLNETAIGLHLPPFGIQLARARLPPQHLTQAAIMARLYAPDEAIEAGFLDEVVVADAVRTTAIAKAQAWSTLHAEALAYNKAAFRDDAIARVLAALED